jgi:hypothetical protein
MKLDEKTFIEGQRFRLSKLGAERCPRCIVQVGNIVRVRKNSVSITVKFDGNKKTTLLHRDYIEPE